MSTRTNTNTNKKTTTKSQRDRLADFLTSGKKITTAEAERKFGMQNVSARIFELRERGYDIRTFRTVAKGGAKRGQVVYYYQIA